MTVLGAKIVLDVAIAVVVMVIWVVLVMRRSNNQTFKSTIADDESSQFKFKYLNNRLIGKDSGFKRGDIITRVNNRNVSDINSMIREIDNSSKVM